MHFHSLLLLCLLKDIVECFSLILNFILKTKTSVAGHNIRLTTLSLSLTAFNTINSIKLYNERLNKYPVALGTHLSFFFASLGSRNLSFGFL